MCLRAIKKVKNDPQAAMITCYAGGERLERHMRKNGEPSDNIADHIIIAEHLFKKHKYKLEEVEEPVAGFFMLLNRKIAREIRFFQKAPSINNVDKIFCERLLKAGYHIYRMPGLYVYHRRRMKHLQWK